MRWLLFTSRVSPHSSIPCINLIQSHPEKNRIQSRLSRMLRVYKKVYIIPSTQNRLLKRKRAKLLNLKKSGVLHHSPSFENEAKCFWVQDRICFPNRFVLRCPKYPNPSKLAILRTLPLLYSFIHLPLEGPIAHPGHVGFFFTSSWKTSSC